MTSQQKMLGLLLDLGNPAERRTRTELIERAMHTALILVDADAVVFLSPSNRRGERLALHAGSAAPALVPPSSEVGEVLRRFGENCMPLAIADLSDDPRIAQGDHCPGVEPGPTMFIPVRQRDPALGYIATYRRRGRARFSPNDARLMLLLTAWLSTALESLRLATGHERLAITDEVTEVYNPRFLKMALRRELRRASRFRQELSIIMVDVDHLKVYNDTHGDLRGSLVLRDVASLLAQQVRSFDLMARYGGDAFMLILPQTGATGAIEVAERMRMAVERHAFAPAAAGAITVSLGVASFPGDGTDSDSLIASADAALATARERGRNCVETPARRAA